MTARSFVQGSPARLKEKTMHTLAVAMGVLVAVTAQVPPAAKPMPDKVMVKNCLVSLITNGEAMVPAREAGFLAELGAVEGQQVARGDLLGQIDDTQAKMEHKIAGFEYQAAKAEADSKVNVDYARATYNVAVADYNRGLDANRQMAKSVPATEIDKLRLTCVQTNLATAKAENDLKISGYKAQVSEGKRDAAAEAIDRRRITSPLDGEVVEVKKNRGEWVQAGETVAHVMHLDRLRVEGFLNVTEYELGEVAGRPVTVTVQRAHGNQETFPGKVVFADKQIQAGGRYRVRAEVTNRQANGEWLLLPGRNAEMIIQLR
jgi:multidrug efflux pump subunit AcrA (membrane-fusion protein)